MVLLKKQLKGDVEDIYIYETVHCGKLFYIL